MKSKELKRKSWDDRLFIIIDYIVLCVILIVIAYPLLYVIAASFSSGAASMRLSLIPTKFSLVGYEAVFKYKDIWIGYANSLFYMVAGTFISLMVTVFCAYPLSRKDFKGRNVIMIICMVTMYFSGGLIPTFLTVKNLHLLNTRLALLLPGAMSVYNMIVTRTYFMSSIPSDLREAAQIDGCGNIGYMIRILLPLAKPILAVTGLFYAVGYWNSYFDAMIYVSAKREYYPLALILREILVLNSADLEQIDINTLMALQERQNVMKYAVIVVASVPVMAIYPFIQKFFVKGVMIGAVKE